MIGVLLLSHGNMAKGMLNSCGLFFGNDLKAIKALCLEGDMGPEQYDELIQATIKEIDDGSGIIAFVDLLNGTPANRCAYKFINDSFRVVTGMNFSMLLEILSKRESYNDVKEIDIYHLIECGRESIRFLNEALNMNYIQDDEL